jgi:small subunit ribosomal protein S6
MKEKSPLQKRIFIYNPEKNWYYLQASGLTTPCQRWPLVQKEVYKMKKYEVMYIINASVEDDKRAALIESVSNIITTNGGKVNKTDEWGMRDFAYRIDDMTKGYYVVSAFEADNACVKEFDRLMGLNANVVRYMITKDEAPVQEAK